MTLAQLKQEIENKTLNSDPLVLKYSDNTFICDQYVNAICSFKNLNKTEINFIAESESNDDFFGMESDKLYVIKTESFQEYPTKEHKNLVVIAKSVPDNMEVDYVDVTKVVNWQIEDFVKSRLQGLTEQEVIWLCGICKYDIYRLDQECKKLELFPVAAQRGMFKRVNEDNGYCDLTDMNIFNFADAVIKRDVAMVGKLIPDLQVIDIEPLGVVTIMLKKFKQILAIQTNCQSAIKALGMSDKQLWFLKKNQCGIYKDSKLINNIEFLTSIDGQIKSGNLDMNKDQLLAYIISKIL